LIPETATTDDLASVSDMVAGQSVIFIVATHTNTITIKHGTGNIICPGESDIEISYGSISGTFDGTNLLMAGGGAATSIIETSGPTTLVIEEIADGEYLKRDGATLVGGTPAGGGSTDGWMDESHTWAYASASTFTVAGVDVTDVLTKGTKLKFTQTTDKFAVVVSSTFSTNTTVTIAVNTDYTIANAAITSPKYSYQSPPDFPCLFHFSPNFTNVTVGNGTLVAVYSINCGMCHGRVGLKWADASATSAISGQPSFTAPITPAVLMDYQSVGNVSLVDNATKLYMGATVLRGSGEIEMRQIKADETYAFWFPPSSTVPFTWAELDNFAICFDYYI
jgi:hypothetical protein